MSDSAPEVEVPVEEAPKGASPTKSPGKGKKEKAAKSDKPKKPKAAPTHPPVSEMVVTAIKTLNEKGGSSVIAIKKFLVATYKVEIEKLLPFVKKFLKGAVLKGEVLQVKGIGASGSFKLPPPAKKVDKPAPAPKKKAPRPKREVEKKEKKVVEKKPKPAAEKKVAKPAAKKPAAKKPAKPAAKKPAAKASPKKAAAKPKAKPAPKKAAAKPKAAAKKPAKKSK